MGDLKNIYYLLQQQLLSYYSTDRKIERELSERANSLNLSSYERGEISTTTTTWTTILSLYCRGYLREREIAKKV